MKRLDMSEIAPHDAIPLAEVICRTDVLKKHMDKIHFTGTIVSVKARIRLIRSFDQVPTHQYQGYTLILDGEIDSIPCTTTSGNPNICAAARSLW